MVSEERGPSEKWRVGLRSQVFELIPQRGYSLEPCKAVTLLLSVVGFVSSAEG